MDNKLKEFNWEPLDSTGDTMVNYDLGVAYQTVVTPTISEDLYDEQYFLKYIGYENLPVALQLNKGRLDLTYKHASGDILDVGIGSGQFIKSSWETNHKHTVFGTDINKSAIVWLKDKRLWVDPYANNTIPQNINTLTFWDSIEHFVDPSIILNLFRPGMHLITSIPVHEDLTQLKKSKHFRPEEHLYHFSSSGIKNYLGLYGFEFVEYSDFETIAGRDSIGSFVFRKK